MDAPRETPIVERARLVTRDLAVVAEEDLPPFRVLPEVLVWGQRTFVLLSEGGLGLDPSGRVYRTWREACAYYLR